MTRLVLLLLFSLTAIAPGCGSGGGGSASTDRDAGGSTMGDDIDAGPHVGETATWLGDDTRLFRPDGATDLGPTRLAVALSAVTEQPVPACTPVSLRATVTGAGDVPLVYFWELTRRPGQAVYTFDSSETEATLVSGNAGDYEVQLTVCKRGASVTCAIASARIAFELVEDVDDDGIDDRCIDMDSGIVLFVVSDINGTPHTCERLSFTAHGTSEDGTELSYAWDVVPESPAARYWTEIYEGSERTLSLLTATPGVFEVVLTACVADDPERCVTERSAVYVRSEPTAVGAGRDERCADYDGGLILEVGYRADKLNEACLDLSIPARAESLRATAIDWEWTLVDQPEGALRLFAPSGDHLRFMASTGGAYHVRVEACLQSEPGTCASSSFPIDVVVREDADGDGNDDRCGAVERIVWTEVPDYEQGTAANVRYEEGSIFIDEFFEAVDTRVLWVPSSASNEVVAFDLDTLEPMGGGPHAACVDPSRLGQDGAGHAFVSCRGDGVVMKIAPTGEVSWRVDFQTINGERQLRGATFVPRAGGDDRVYVGCSSKAQVVILSAEDGALRETIDTIPVYGLAADTERVYVAGLNDAIQAIEIETNELLWTSREVKPYGITASDGVVWATGLGALRGVCALEGGSGELLDCAPYPIDTSFGRGVGLSPVDGSVWAAVNHPDHVLKVDPVSYEILGDFDPACATPTGVAGDRDNEAYVICQGSSTVAHLDAEGTLLGHFGGAQLVRPYAYSSDMTGIGNGVGYQGGSWLSNEVNMGEGETTVMELSWDATVPPGTGITVHYRLDGGALREATNGDGLSELGERIRFRVALRSEQQSLTPSLDELRLVYARW